jgi:hypothetical protein
MSHFMSRSDQRYLLPITTVLAVLALLGIVWSTVTGAAEQSAAPSAPFKRRDTSTSTTLAAELMRVDEIDLIGESSELRQALVGQINADARAVRSIEATENPPTLGLVERRWVVLGLTPQTGKEARIEREAAEQLGTTARQMRREGLVMIPGRKASDSLKQMNAARLLEQGLQLRPGDNALAAKFPALVQLLQPEGDPSRAALVELLTSLRSPASSKVLAQRALYDLSAANRQAAVRALADRSYDDFRQVLLDGFRYPWAPVADHAAEAIVDLNDQQAMPFLTKLLEEPDPRNPILLPKTGKPPVVRELVRLNHLRNCLLCHPPSLSERDPVTGPVPVPGTPLVVYYEDQRSRSRGDVFVRADVTYLRQDFSVMQGVDNPRYWPNQQRFDFLLRTRSATVDELGAGKNPMTEYPQRQAVRWAIKELQNADLRPKR